MWLYLIVAIFEAFELTFCEERLFEILSTAATYAKTSEIEAVLAHLSVTVE